MRDDKGHFRCYRDKTFNDEHLKIIRAANAIIEEYDAAGFSLTLRQIYYQFVARGWLPNKQREYDRLGSIISDGRMAGLISWTAIEDRNRSLMGTRTIESPRKALEQAHAGYAIDKWKDQPWRPEVWVEKAALEGVVGSMCEQLQVDFFACRGYNSQSEQWRAGQRFAGYIRKGQRPIVFHFGDHDPSGLDMTRDNAERLEVFAGVPIMVQRLALNISQIEEFNPPPNPAKMTDSRFKAYSEEYGESSWELDALDPMVIHKLIKDAVLSVRDEALWTASTERETSERRMLKELLEFLPK